MVLYLSFSVQWKIEFSNPQFFEPPDPDSSNQWLLPPSQIQ